MKQWIRSILRNEEDWCQMMGYKNVYLDPFEYHITDSVVTGDGTAFKRFPENRHVYDKLWVADTQGLRCGQLEDLNGNEDTMKYPIFIKPRWGHLSAASKNCYKISNPDRLKQFRGYEHMMWSDYVDGTEGMTDMLMLNGRIVYQLTYKYSDEQNGYSDVWKYVSPDTPAPQRIIDWANKNVRGHTGFVNIQYRNDKIIEVGLRPARSGAYIIATDNEAIMRNIYNAMDRQYWDDSLNSRMRFKPYYAFKCYTTMPIIHIWPQSFIDLLLPMLTDRPLYEYYFEPVGSDGMVFFQFMHDDFEKGMRAKRIIECLFALTQIVVAAAIVFTIHLLVTKRNKLSIIVAAVLFFLLITRFLNPLHTNYNLYKGYRQMFSGKDSMRSPDDYAQDISDVSAELQ